jgi:hypothetical protein
MYLTIKPLASGYGLDDWGSIPGGAENFSLRHHVQTSSGTHSTTYPFGTGGSFRGGKAAGA